MRVKLANQHQLEMFDKYHYRVDQWHNLKYIDDNEVDQLPLTRNAR